MPMSAAMCDLAQILVSFTTYPHVDVRATGRRTAELLHRAMAGDIHPHTYRAHRPMLEEANGGRTDLGPMIDRHAMARAFEARKGVYAISINGAFPCADIAEVGPTVLVTGEGDTAALEAVAEELADDIWARRHEALNQYLTPGRPPGSRAPGGRVAGRWSSQTTPTIPAPAPMAMRPRCSRPCCRPMSGTPVSVR
jgi:microcystin degradation protein MlrC